MTEGYNFETYYKNTTAKAEINLDLSGIDIEKPAENLNEHVTNNVMYYVSYIWGSNSPNFVDSETTIFGLNDRLAIRTDEADGSYTFKYAAPLHPISDIMDADVSSQWDPGSKREFSFDLDEQDASDGIHYFRCDDSSDAGTVFTEYKYIRIFVFPRYEAIDGKPDNYVTKRILGNPLSNQSMTVNQNPIGIPSNYVNLPRQMRVVYAILGLLGTNYPGFKWLERNILNGERLSKSLRSNAVFSEKRFKSVIRYLSNLASEKNYGIDVKYYDKSYSEPVNVEDATKEDYKRSKSYAKAKHKIYLNALQRADITKTEMPGRVNYNLAYGKYLQQFMTNSKCAALVDNMVPPDDGTSALIPPLKDAVKAIFFDKEDLENTFFDTFENVYSGLMKVANKLRKYLKATTVKKLVETGKRYQSAPAGKQDMAFDMQYLLNILYKRLDDNMVGTGNEYTANGTVVAFPRVYAQSGRLINKETSGINHSGFGVIAFSPGYFTNRSNGGFVSAPPGIAYHWAVPTDTGARYEYGSTQGVYRDDYYFVQAQSALYGDYTDNYAPRNKEVVEMSGREIKQLLVDYYNWIYNYGDREDGLEFTIDDLCTIDGIAGNYKYGWTPTIIGNALYGMPTIPSGRSPYVVNGLNQFVEYIGGYMNFFRVYGAADKEAERNVHITNCANVTMQNFVITVVENGLAQWTINDDDTFSVIDWGQSSSTDKLYAPSRFMAGYESKWTLEPEAPTDVDEAIQYAYLMRRAYKELRRVIQTKLLSIGPLTAYRCSEDLDDIDDDLSKLYDDVSKIAWYQTFVNESAFTNKSVLGNFGEWLQGNVDETASDSENGGGNVGISVWNLPARFMVPVHMYERRKVKVKVWGRTRHRYRSFSIGIRWAEVRFYDLNVYNEYPQVVDAPGRMLNLSISADYAKRDDGTYSIIASAVYPNDIVVAKGGELVINGDYDNRMSATVLDDTTLVCDGPFPSNTGTITLTAIKLPPDKSQNDNDEKSNVTISYKMPSLPYDSEIRKKAFSDYGPFSQDRLFEVYRFGDGGFDTDTERHDGWKVFHSSSKKIEDLRPGVDIYNKVAMLISILKHEFGSERVELIDTYRSLEDQKTFSAGGPESVFLSWHNFGLAAKIVIYQTDLTTPIEDKSDDMMKLLKIARAFTEGCRNGVFGKPCNLVWCGRLVINPSLFDWEFLPLGVEHKDAPKFRDIMLSQRDPVVELGYINVDAAGYVASSPKTDGTPYVIRSSGAYRNAAIVNGEHYMSPRFIRNYQTPDDIVLYDIIEYINLIQTKMDANGTQLTDKASMREWKSLNDSACTQLIMYYALTNNVGAAKSLIAGEYMEHYQPVEDAYYGSSAVDYVKGMLGALYDEVHVTIDANQDSSYITLKDGILHVRATDIYPDNLPTMQDMHKQKSVDREHLKTGIWKDGIFYGEDEIEIPFSESDAPVIGGYNAITGLPESGDAVYLHRIIATQLHDEFVKNSKRFMDFSGSLLYDEFRDGPNAKMYDMLENEFGLIKAQDLMDFDTLEAMLAKDKINELADKYSDSNGVQVLGADKTVYEEVIDHAELAGFRKASITREKVHINDRKSRMTPEQLYKIVTKGAISSGHDLI